MASSSGHASRGADAAVVPWVEKYRPSTLEDVAAHKDIVDTVKRLVDEEGGNVVYAVFSQRLDKNEDNNNSRFKSNLCAVAVDKFE